MIGVDVAYFMTGVNEFKRKSLLSPSDLFYLHRERGIVNRLSLMAIETVWILHRTTAVLLSHKTRSEFTPQATPIPRRTHGTAIGSARPRRAPGGRRAAG